METIRCSQNALFHVASDYFVFVVLHTLPWIGKEFSAQMPAELGLILKKVGAYLGQRKKLHLKVCLVFFAMFEIENFS